MRSPLSLWHHWQGQGPVTPSSLTQSNGGEIQRCASRMSPSSRPGEEPLQSKVYSTLMQLDEQPGAKSPFSKAVTRLPCGPVLPGPGTTQPFSLPPQRGLSPSTRLQLCVESSLFVQPCPPPPPPPPPPTQGPAGVGVPAENTWGRKCVNLVSIPHSSSSLMACSLRGS